MCKTVQTSLCSSGKKLVSKNIIARQRDREWIELYLDVRLTDWIKSIKTIEGRIWDPQKKCWVAPYVKATFYHLRDQIKLSNITFLFKIEARIPDKYSIPQSKQSLDVTHPVSKFDQLTEDQKNAVHSCEQFLNLRRYSYRTISNYRHHLINLFRFHKNIAPENFYPEHVQIFIMELIKVKRISASAQNQIINAYKIYAEKILKRPKEYVEIPRPRKFRKLPSILSSNEVRRLINALDNLKHKLSLMLIYSSGLRVSELTNLQLCDLQIERRRIRIVSGKGNKDRYVVLAETIIPFLKKYMIEFKPKRWLIEGMHGGQYSQRSIQNVFHHAIKKSNLITRATLHTLRHSYATHCLENGHNIKTIQASLGHKSLKTTEVYLHLTSNAMSGLKSPLDQMKL